MQPAGKNILIESIVATVILSTVALLDFYAVNARELTSGIRLVPFAEGTLGAVAIFAGCLRLLLPGFALWRILLATGLATFVFYSYGEMAAPLKAHLGPWLPLSWMAITLAVGVLALIFLRRLSTISIVLALSVAFSAPSLARIVTFLASDHPSQSASDEPGASTVGVRISPNIYWIVLDGYPRQDVLQKYFGFDNSGFIQSLTSLGFTVLGKSLSNFPATIYSISSTLSTDYVVRANGDEIEPFALKEMYPIVRGKSRAVASFKAAGYHYVHFENGYDYLTECDANEPRCVRGNVGLDELDTAILSNTPIIDLIVDWDKLKGRISDPFALGGVEDLTDKLDMIRKTPARAVLRLCTYPGTSSPDPLPFRLQLQARGTGSQGLERFGTASIRRATRVRQLADADAVARDHAVGSPRAHYSSIRPWHSVQWSIRKSANRLARYRSAGAFRGAECAAVA
jgi:hypothetical protein